MPGFIKIKAYHHIILEIILERSRQFVKATKNYSHKRRAV